MCENHQTMAEKGMIFVRTVVRLMKRLLEYRAIVTDENKENRMSCTVNLLVSLCDIIPTLLEKYLCSYYNCRTLTY